MSLRCRYHPILRPYGDLPKFTNSRRGHSDVWVRFDPHLTRQTTKSYVERGYAFGLVVHSGSLAVHFNSACSAARRTLHLPALALILGCANDPKSSLSVQASIGCFTSLGAPLTNGAGDADTD